VTTWCDERVIHAACAGCLVARERLDDLQHGRTGTDECGAATCDDALLDRCTSRRHGVFDAVLLFLQLDLGRCTDLDDGNATGELGEALLELLAIPVGVGVVDLGLDLADAGVDFVLLARAIHDRGVVLVDDDALGAAEQVEGDVLQLETDFLADDLTTGEDRHVLEHRLATVSETWGLDCCRVERAADLVHDERRECFTLDVLGDDHHRATRLHDTLEHRQHRLDGRDLCRVEEDVWILEHGLLAVCVGHEVRRQVTLVELHTLGELELGAERVRLLDRHDAVLADLVDRICDDLADGCVSCRDGRDAGDVVLVVDFLGLALDRLDCCSDCLFDAALETHRVRACGNVAHAVLDHRLGEDRCGRGAVTGHVVGLRRDFLDELSAHVLERIFQFDFLGDRHAVVGDGWCAELLVEHHVATLWSQRHLHCVGELVHAGFEGAACLFVKLQLLCHVCLRSFCVVGGLLADDCENVAAGEDEQVLARVADFGAAVLAVQNGVADLDVEREVLAFVVAPTAWADGEHLALLRLFLGGVGNDETRCRALLGFAWLNNDPVV